MVQKRDEVERGETIVNNALLGVMLLSQAVELQGKRLNDSA